MPKQKTALQVFVASPSDVNDERRSLDTVIAELNVMFSRTLGIVFEVVKWETDVRPGFADEPQQVINSQIPDDYDIFVGIFWTRAGTPTKTAKSGSIEEFQLALKRLRSHGSLPEIMVYFKDAPAAITNIDTDQLKSLNEFKASLAGQGGLYSTFKDQSSFEASLRTHLSSIAHQIHSSAGPVSVDSNLPNRPSPPDDSLELEDDLVFLDYAELHSESSKGMTDCIDLMANLLNSHGEHTRKQTKRIQESLASPERARALVNLQANDMNSLADDLEPTISRHAKYREISFDSLSKAVSLHVQMGGPPAELATLKNSLKSLVQTMLDAKASTLGTKHATISIPRLTKDLNRGKKRLASALDHIIDEIERTISTTENVIESIERIS